MSKAKKSLDSCAWWTATLFVLTILVSSCHRDCDTGNLPTITITDKTKQYFSNFSEESFWELENYSDTLDRDTLVLTNKTSGTNFLYAEKCPDGNYEFIKYKLISKISKDTLSANITTNKNIDTYSLQGKFHNLQFFCQFILTKSTGQIWVNTTFGDTLQSYNTYSIKNKQFNDVVKMTFTQLSPSYPNQAPTYFYSRNIGLIEFIVYDKVASSKKIYWLKNYLIK